ncbi:hypothetical protein ACLB90_19045 [Stenotrophomonas sp. LGBM10]|uniref:hypothetical protein n=1 Tax=Stenotrophomonas sp. LGBM10 TaxID=3390038 RepID=UPI00398A8EF0
MSGLYTAFIDVALPVEVIDPHVLHRRLLDLTTRLADVHPLLATWYEPPRADAEAAVPLSDSAQFIARIARNAAQDLVMHPHRPMAGGADANLRNMRRTHDWLMPGRLSMSYMPWCGRLTFDLNEPFEAFGAATPTIVRGCIAAVAASLDALFIGTDVSCPLAGGSGFDSYALDHRLFPHRRWLGWMGFVPELVPHRYIPEAASVHVVKGCGTIIVSVEGCLDLHNRAHLRQVHEVEARMAQLGLLDLTDATLLE